MSLRGRTPAWDKLGPLGLMLSNTSAHACTYTEEEEEVEEEKQKRQEALSGKGQDWDREVVLSSWTAGGTTTPSGLWLPAHRIAGR